MRSDEPTRASPIAIVAALAILLFLIVSSLVRLPSGLLIMSIVLGSLLILLVLYWLLIRFGWPGRRWARYYSPPELYERYFRHLEGRYEMRGQSFEREELVGIVISVWRLAQAIRDGRRSASDKESRALQGLLDAMTSSGIGFIDPQGRWYYPENSSEFMVSRYDPIPTDQAFVSETITPGVVLRGKVLQRPSVVIARPQSAGHLEND